jgi:multiple antibiotic resistance protein
MALKIFRDNIPKKKIRMVFDHNMEIFLRLNGFFVGAIGINMVKVGIENLLK